MNHPPLIKNRRRISYQNTVRIKITVLIQNVPMQVCFTAIQEKLLKNIHSTFTQQPGW